MERRRIIERLVKKLNQGEQLPINEDYLSSASKLTGLHPKVLKDLENNDEFKTNIEPVDRSVIYEKMVTFYTIKNKVPNTYELYNSLHGLIPPYIDIGMFRKILVKMGFVWKKVSPTTAVIIEDPIVRFERYNYLKKIQFYRSTNTDIYYIEVGSYDSNGNYRDYKLTKELVLDVLQKDWVRKVIYALGPNGIHALEEIEDFSCDTVELWVRDSLMPRIDNPSLFIINNNNLFNNKLVETPTLDSLKSDIKRWLDIHKVTYDDKMSKYELFGLADKFTDLNKNFFKIDEMLKCDEHCVLRIPKCIGNVTSSALLARVVDANLSEAVEANVLKSAENSVSAITSVFKDLIVGAGSMYIEKFEKYISTKEAELIEMDDNVDHVYDMLIAKAGNTKSKDTNLDDSDIPSCSDSE